MDCMKSPYEEIATFFKSCCLGQSVFFNAIINLSHGSGSAITNWREPRSCLGRGFNSKLGCIAATLGSKRMVCMRPLLKLKTLPKARPVS